MTAISGRGGQTAALPSLSDDDDDPNSLEEIIAEAALQATTGQGDTSSASDAGSVMAGTNAPLTGTSTPPEAPESTRTTRDAQAALASQQAGDKRDDLSNARDAQKAVGGRSQGIPQALGERGSDDRESLSAAAIAAHIGRVRI